MKRKIILGLFSLLPLSSWAQHPGDYIKWEDKTHVVDGKEKSKTDFTTAYTKWSKGNVLYPGNAEDENFFISRVRFKSRFRNPQTQVKSDLTEDRDKNVLCWLPVGAVDGHKDNALPSGIFDSDVFSMWSYVTHYGNWTAPMIRVPGSFSDIVHKNGVGTSSVASIAWGHHITQTDDWGKLFLAFNNGGSEKFVDFLNHYGIDGWGMNSEFNSYSGFANMLQGFMADVYQNAITDGQLPSYISAWYTLINNQGELDASWNGLSDGNRNWYHKNGKPISNAVFGNYNWNVGQLRNNDNIARAANRDPREVYAGMNIQGSEGKNWTLLKNAKTSIGLWGAHNMNIFFEGRNELGSTDDAKQSTYQTRIERFFTNGNQNPAKPLDVKNTLTTSAGGLKEFHGVSAMATAKSVLSWDLSKEAFYTYFNLGNGKFFNLQGERAYDNPWYNIAMQDYLPTWRYWFSSDFLGTDVHADGLSASFTWNDAWFGGSCLEIIGSTDKEYLHLFKTNFEVKEGDNITVRYKVLSGSGQLDLIASARGSESTEVTSNILDGSSSVELGEWQEKTIKVSTSGRNNLRIANSTIAAIALKFSSAKDLKILLGEFSIKRGNYTKPSTPVVLNELSRTLKYTYKGIDAKLNFKMPAPSGKTDDDRLYNDDVNTSFFKIYSKQEGGEPMFVGATTSWAALIYNAPMDASKGNKIKFGVSAVGLDGVTESEIAWSKDFDTPSVTVVDEIEIDKSTIKPNQNFTVRFVDTNHPVANSWKVYKTGTTDEVYSTTGVKSFTTTISEIGIYDLKLIDNKGKETVYPGFIQISKKEVGAVPEIKTLTFNSEDIVDGASVNTTVSKENILSYTGADADGITSRGLNLKENPMGVKPGTVGINSKDNSWTIALWVKFSTFNGSTQLLNVRDPGGPWPNNNWGFIWSGYDPNGGNYELALRSSGNDHYRQLYENLNLKTGSWTHMAYVYEAKNGKYNIRLYINGKYVPASKWDYQGTMSAWAKAGDGQGTSNKSDLRGGHIIMFGGSTRDLSGIDGVVDDVKFFKKALSQEEIGNTMFSDDKGEPNLFGFWDFENNVNPDATINSVATSNPNGKLSWGKFEAGVGEGVMLIKPAEPSFEAGSPFVTGNIFKVETKPTWTFPKGVVADADGSDTAGSAKVTYGKDGVFTGTLILSNSWGKDTRTITAINVGSATGVELTDEVSLQAFPNPFVETVNIRFPESGEYVATIYDVKGSVVSSKAVTADSGSIFTINLNAPKGLYLLRVTTQDGKLLRTLKLIKN